MISNLHVLRAVAALGVVWYHTHPILNSAFDVDFWTDFGDAGVDIFFVISGFIMFHSNK
ncbi:MAG: acyltransferase family protein, partial [Caulobacterales bacterium]